MPRSQRETDTFEHDPNKWWRVIVIPSTKERHKESSAMWSVIAVLSCSREAEEPGYYILFY